MNEDMRPEGELPELCIDHCDAVEWLRQLPTESLDLVVTDPAYESLEKHRKRGTTTRLKNSRSSSNEWFDIFPNARFEELFAELYRVLKKGTHLYVFCDQETMFHIKPIGEAAGLTFWKPIVWDKMKIGMGYHYRARYEFILFFEKGKRKLNNLGTPDVLEVQTVDPLDGAEDILKVPRVYGGYPTEKPVELLKILIKQSTRMHELVADPFMGSGATAEAARLLARDAAGCDTKLSAVENALARVASIEPFSDEIPF